STLGETEIWYRANNPGAITTVAFTFTTGTTASLEVSEYSGALVSSPVDKTGSSTVASATASTVSTSAATVAAGELAVTSSAEPPDDPSGAAQRHRPHGIGDGVAVTLRHDRWRHRV